LDYGVPLPGREVTAVDVQIFNKPFAESFWLQIAVLVVLTAVLISVAARYVW
jgi:hypothetical protein